VVREGRKYLLQAFALNPEYLKNEATEMGQVIDYKDWQIALGRRFRALKLWFVLRSYGVEGIQGKIRHAAGLATYFEALLASAGGEFEVSSHHTPHTPRTPHTSLTAIPSFTCHHHSTTS
jgi:aromatic-L-amino-acid decarboxylase